jgi:hypothetical protein
MTRYTTLHLSVGHVLRLFVEENVCQGFDCVRLIMFPSLSPVFMPTVLCRMMKRARIASF